MAGSARLAGESSGFMPPADDYAEVLVDGRVFFDMIFAGIPRMPRRGEEVYAAELVTCPGGAANRAIACSRLGLRTKLAAAFGDDEQGKSCWETLAGERVDLTLSRRYGGWRTPVTVSAALNGDQAMLTHALRLPEPSLGIVGRDLPSRAAIIELDPLQQTSLLDEPLVHTTRAKGTRTFVTTCFDSSGHWSRSLLVRLRGCFAVLPNEMEALGYTHAETLDQAVGILSEFVPLVIVTRGERGALGYDASTGEGASVPALPTIVRDTTGAGDVFAAAIVYGTSQSWSLHQCLAFANLCSSLAIKRVGSSISSPTWDDIATWRSRMSGGALDRVGSWDEAGAIRERYAFLDDVRGPYSTQ